MGLAQSYIDDLALHGVLRHDGRSQLQSGIERMSNWNCKTPKDLRHLLAE